MTATVAFVLKGYPRLSETFIAHEIKALEALGLDIRIFSLRRPTDTKRHAVHGEISAAVSYLPEYLYQEPLRVYRAWRKMRRRPGYKSVLHKDGKCTEFLYCLPEEQIKAASSAAALGSRTR